MQTHCVTTQVLDKTLVHRYASRQSNPSNVCRKYI